ncbi:MAG: hypothetical protein A3D28_01615 [Omnitrophica bacterium RIFCSPHIGHO2_02_FULL_63_14]|nr:MAG: hypothetical protein A3D28_01615 [Omnitrophica bacterium RIFCSPHIGHO2_02_FULL_63_14]
MRTQVGNLPVVPGGAAAGRGQGQATRARWGSWALVVLVLTVGVIATLFRHGDGLGESTLYWFFARLFAEEGAFNIPDRSPLYVLYLQAFRWLGYPQGVVVEYVITSLLVASALVALIARHVGLKWGTWGALCWLPFLQHASPSVQQLALACSIWGLLLRGGTPTRRRWVASYAWMGLAYLFRSSYAILPVLFGVWDLLRLRFQRLPPTVGRIARVEPVSDWPLAVLLGLMVWFHAAQSTHAWNNANAATVTWFPVRARSLADSHFIQAFNITYLKRYYQGDESRDFYFSNLELFHGAEDVWSAIRANPGFIIVQTLRNARAALDFIPTFTEFPKVSSAVRPPALVFNLLLVLGLLYGAIRMGGSQPERIFILAHVPLVASAGLILPEIARHYVPLVPLLLFSGCWYGLQVRGLLARGPGLLCGLGAAGVGLVSLSLWVMRRVDTTPWGPLTIPVVGLGYGVSLLLLGAAWQASRIPGRQPLRLLLQGLAIPLVLAVCSDGPGQWAGLWRDLVEDIHRGGVRVMESRPGSLKASSQVIGSLIHGCRGVMAMEHTFIAAFIAPRSGRVYDIWEIPPFGSLYDSVYDGLRPDRIDCVLVSHELATGVGMGTNYRIRYEHYIQPYVAQLQGMGAVTHDIRGFGQAVILPRRG